MDRTPPAAVLAKLRAFETHQLCAELNIVTGVKLYPEFLARLSSPSELGAAESRRQHPDRKWKDCSTTVRTLS